MSGFWGTVHDDLRILGVRSIDQILNVIFSGSFHLIFAHRISHFVSVRIS